jgi:peptidoglycan/LPS O-acetylase OafA/YrhL
MFAYFGNSLLIKMTIILVTLIVSYLSYVYIEIPIQKFIKSRVASW